MASFRFSLVAFRQQVLNAEWMRAEMVFRAETARILAEAISPVETGEYAESFHVDSGLDGGWDHDRAFAILENFSPHALYVEFGTEHMAAHYVLHKAIGLV